MPGIDLMIKDPAFALNGLLPSVRRGPATSSGCPLCRFSSGLGPFMEARYTCPAPNAAGITVEAR